MKKQKHDTKLLTIGLDDNCLKMTTGGIGPVGLAMDLMFIGSELVSALGQSVDKRANERKTEKLKEVNLGYQLRLEVLEMTDEAISKLTTDN